MIIRHDIDDQKYLDLGEQYSSSMAYLDGCAGTLIDSSWVLTAAHCIDDKENELVTVSHNGNTHRIEKIVVHPEWNKDASDGYDVAMVQLKDAIEIGKPVKLYDQADENGQPVAFVGRGGFGNGRDGNIRDDGKQRGATNTIVSVSEQHIGFEFDSPESESATAMEGISGGGDSGGPAFVTVDSHLYIAGVSSYQDRNEHGESTYGVLEFYARVSTNASWIRSVLEKTKPAELPLSHPIIEAIKNNDHAQFYKNVNSDVFSNTDLMSEAFYQTIVLNRIEMAGKLANSGANIASIKILQMSLFEFAVQQKRFKYLDMLLNNSSSINNNYFLQSSLVPKLIQADGSDDQIINRLRRVVDKGANIDARIEDGVTGLMIAVFDTDNIELVRYLVEHGADVNARHDSGNRPLMASIVGGKNEILKYLLDNGAFANFYNNKALSPLAAANEMGDAETIRLLENNPTSSLAQEFDVEKMNQLFDAIESNDRGMGSLSIHHAGTEVYQRSIGFENLETSTKATSETRYRVGSITKSFTAAIITQMVEEGKLKFDTKLCEYYRKIKNSDNITIEHLLRHRSGLFNFTDDPAYTSYMESPQSEKAFLKRIRKHKNSFKPDAEIEYSNTGYVLLSFIAEKVDGKTFDLIVQDRIAGPQNLKNTYVGGKIGDKGSEAQSYKLGKEWLLSTETDMSIPSGAGAIVSTPSDINKFYHALFTGKIVKPSSVELMKSMKDGYGFGLLELPFYKMIANGHTGSIDGFNSMAGYFGANATGVTYVSNGTDWDINDLLIGVLNIYFGIDYEIPVFKELDVSGELLEQYTGMYTSPTHPLDIVITIVDKYLTAQATGQGAFRLRARGDHLFVFDPARITMTFNIETESMAFTQRDQKHEFRKKASSKKSVGSFRLWQIAKSRYRAISMVLKDLKP